MTVLAAVQRVTQKSAVGSKLQSWWVPVCMVLPHKGHRDTNPTPPG